MAARAPKSARPRRTAASKSGTAVRRTTTSMPYEVRASTVHGAGLFATRDIPKDVLIGRAEGRATKRNGMHVLWYADKSGESVGLRVDNEVRYANHARPGNAAFYGAELWSLRRIRKGEEILFDYGADW